jgi:heptosyltransferase-2
VLGFRVAARRLLLVRTSALGDVLLVAPVADALRAAGASVELLTDARLVPLVTALGAFDRVHGLDPRGADAGLLGHLRRARALGAFDGVVDLQGKLRTRLVARAIRAAARATLVKRGPLRAIAALLGRDRPLDDAHDTELYRRVLDRPSLAPGLQLGAPRLPADAAGPQAAGAQRAQRIGLGIGTTHATKRWPTEHWVALGRALLDEARAEGRARTLVLVGGPRDAALLDAVRAGLPADAVDAARLEAAPVEALAPALAGLAALVSVDSGPAHLAQRLGVPTLVLFGPTSVRRWGPREAPHRALALALDCQPCSNTGGARCPRPDRALACLRTLTPAAAHAALREVLADAAGVGPRADPSGPREAPC